MSLFAAAALALAASAAQDSSVKLGTLAPEGSPWHAALRDMAEDWKKTTNGKVGFRIYPGGVAGDEPDMVRKLRVGQLHAAGLTGVGLAEIAPEIMALQMPMLLQSYEELDYVMERMGPRFEEILLAKGYRVLNWGDAGWVTFFSQKPVASVADLRAQKLFVWNSSGTEVGLWKDFGVQPVPLPATEIHVGLKSGLINALSTTPLAALSFQWFGTANQMSDLRWAPLVAATVITSRRWEQLPAEFHPALLKSSRDGGAKMRTETRRLGDVAVEEMKKRGLAVVPVSPAAKAEWESISRSAYPKLMRSAGIPPAMVAEIEKLRDEQRAQQK